jgi:hypothetical protein
VRALAALQLLEMTFMMPQKIGERVNILRQKGIGTHGLKYALNVMDNAKASRWVLRAGAVKLRDES